VVPAGAGEVTPEGLRVALKEQLPGYMVPAALVVLAALPLTPNGKVDRAALPVPEGERQTGEAYVTPESALERRIASIWCRVLGIGQVGVHDNFFELGGNSLLVMQVRGLIEKELDIGLAIVDLFDKPTVHALAGHCAARRGGGADDAPSSTLAKAQERARRSRTAMHRRGSEVSKERAP
jgi:hypothetical protein